VNNYGWRRALGNAITRTEAAELGMSNAPTHFALAETKEGITMTDVLTALLNVAKALGGVVDKAVPVGVGGRTKYAAIIAVIAPIVGKIACAVYPAACPIVDSLGAAAAALTPVFAAAGLVRDTAK
jgi:hypothetical protein